MHWFLEKVEHFVDRIIPAALIVLIFVLIIELGLPAVAKAFPIVHYLDYAIVGIFIIDLSFKFYRAKTTAYFLRTYWLEIIACFPFFLVFRFLDWFGVFRFGAAELLKEGQGIAHVVTTAEKEYAVGSRVLQTAEREMAAASAVTRTERFARFIRPLYGWAKALHTARFYRHPKE